MFAKYFASVYEVPEREREYEERYTLVVLNSEGVIKNYFCVDVVHTFIFIKNHLNVT
jgi:hypothetical protein